MILQALKGYYDRKSADPDSRMAPPGFEWKEIPFIIVLKTDGTPVSINSTYEGEGKKRRAKSFLMPQSVKKASGIASNLLWDNPEYALGVTLKGKPDRVLLQHEAFKNKINDLGESDDEGLSAVRQFLMIENKVEILQGLGQGWQELIGDGGNITFQLAGDPDIIPERPKIKAIISDSTQTSGQANRSFCLVTGEAEDFERLHPAIKGVYGAQTAGANIVSFNLDAFKSFGKVQGANAPVGKNIAFAYTTALNHLLAKDSKQRMQVGDASTVFWAEKQSDLEKQLPDIFGEPPKDDPDKGVKAVNSLFKSIDNGTYLIDNKDENRFYVLGLSPNAARIAIRFWIVDTVTNMAEKIGQHFKDITIIHGPKEKDVLSLFRLLVSTAAQGKSENIPPNLAGDAMRSILQGLPYPYTLLQASIRRIHAERHVSYPRAALIKACINRSTRFKNPHIKEELSMSLDENNTNIGYRLGRLFATLERIQIRKFTQNGGKEPNSTIREKYYGSASGTPSVVFATLIRLSKHHLASLENIGERINFEKLIAEIMNDINDFPAHLQLEDQGRFAIGYYHQVQKFFSKKTQIESTQSKSE